MGEETVLQIPEDVVAPTDNHAEILNKEYPFIDENMYTPQKKSH